MDLIYSLLDGEPLEQAIDSAAQIAASREQRKRELMDKSSIMGRLIQRGVPVEKAAELTVRCISKGKGQKEVQIDVEAPVKSQDG